MTMIPALLGSLKPSGGGVAPFTETFDTPGPGTWISTVTGNVTIRCWGGGADAVGGNGGGAGEFASSNVAVTVDQEIGYLVGDVSQDSTAMEEAIIARGAVAQGGASGGAGDILFNGGDGGAKDVFIAGGGGGGSGGTTEPGNNGAAGIDGGAGGVGGAIGGGNGGDGALITGENGAVPGGGGGGGLTTNGLGASGRVRIIYPAI